MGVKGLAGRRVAVLGAGKEGFSSAVYLVKHGADVTVCDVAPTLPERWNDLSVSSRLGVGYLDGLSEFEIIVRSPGIPYLTTQVQEAKQSGSILTSQTIMFFDACPVPIVGVSGTKGKGTTASLIARMIEESGQRAWLGGNIGTPFLDFLELIKPGELVVAELSSFQLQDLPCSPHVAVITNLELDHLDHHQSVEEYHAAKRPMVSFQERGDVAILNADDEAVMGEMAGEGRSLKRFFSLRPLKADAYPYQDRVCISRDSALTDVCELSDIIIRGPHNLKNVLAACLAADTLGVSAQSMRRAIKSYRGLPHHLEVVETREGVTYVDDSYATTPTATIPALESFTEPIVLVAGGHDKGLDYRSLAEAIKREGVRAVVLVGEVGPRIKDALKKSHAPTKVVSVDSKEKIVPTARKLAHRGDVVLLSPAAASFGMFTDYVERGVYFAEQVRHS